MINEQVKKKSEYWQIVRGVCILAVIMIHCPSGYNFSTADGTVWLVVRSLINFPVALFIFMAGYFVNAEKVKQNTIVYYIKRGGYHKNTLQGWIATRSLNYLHWVLLTKLPALSARSEIKQRRMSVSEITGVRVLREPRMGFP